MTKYSTSYNLLQGELKKAAKTMHLDVFDAKDDKGIYSSPISILVNTKVSSRPFQGILIKYLDLLRGNELEMVVRSLTEKSNKDVAPRLVKLLKQSKLKSSPLNWVICNALAVMLNGNIEDSVLEIVTDKDYGMSSQMLVQSLFKVRNDQTFKILIDCLDRKEVREHAISALRRLGDSKAIPHLMALEVDKSKFEFKELEKTLNYLTNLKNRD